jgi:predicted DNA-binding protein (MmcQ/YjbR family)
MVSTFADVAHPRMYRDDDPYLSELRAACARFPENVEVEAWGRPTFRAGKKMYAVFVGSEDEHYALIFKPEPGERDALVQDDRFTVPPYFGPGGWLQLEFTRAKVDWTEVDELLEGSYRQVALKRQLKALDGLA